MSKKSSQIASENMSMKFSKGWGIILYQALMFFFLIGFSIDGLNIVAPAFAESTGIAYDQVLGVATWAGMIGVVAYILIARINVSVGPRLLSGVLLHCPDPGNLLYQRRRLHRRQHPDCPVVPQEEGSGQRLHHHGP